MITDKATGTYLARLRDEAGLKQKDLAQRVTWSPAVLSRVESGERSVTSDELDSILAAIGTQKARAFQHAVRREWEQLPRPPLGHPEECLLWQAELKLQAIERLIKKPDIRNAFAKLLSELKQELHNAARLVNGTEHAIALVGDIGVGKSTAICRVSGLEVRDGKAALPIPVLEVGGGGVTVCEVHLVHGPQYGLIVEPMGEQEIQTEVREFASLLKEPSATTRDEDIDEPAFGTSKELERAIRNMSELTKTRRRHKGPDGKSLRVTDDPAKRLAEESSDSFALVVEILTKMKLESRTKRELWYSTETSDKEPLLWLKENFELLNNGRHPEFSIPKRVEIVVPRPVLGEDSPSIRIVDTKGVDRTAERADIENLFSEPNTVVVMCSTFNATPSPSVQQLLKRAKDGRFTDMEHKGAVLGLPRQDEALAVKDDDGFFAESTEEGYELKREQAQTTMQAVGFPNLRVEFFNALGDDPGLFRAVLLDLVHDLRRQHQSNLQILINDARSLVENFEQQQTLEVQRDAAKHLTIWVLNNRELDFSALYHPKRSLMWAIDNAHPSSVRASVRRQGEWYNLDYSHQLGYGARLAAARVVGQKLNDFHPVVDNLLKNPELEEAVGLLRQACRVVDARSETLLKKCQLVGKRIHARHMKPSSELWDKCDSEWGRGPGYRDRVVVHHTNWFNGCGYDYQKFIRDRIDKEWREIIDSLSEILDIA